MAPALQRIVDAKLYGILDLAYVSAGQVAEMTDRMIDGGIEVLQLRAKNFALDEIERLARSVAPRCASASVPFILNDYPGLVPSVGADGVHIGQDDGPIAEARTAAGAGAIVGRSTHSVEQARAAWAEGADYIGFGPLFSTPTKPDYTEIGLSDIEMVFANSPVPVFCIGGIKRETLDSVMAAGATRVVIVSGILKADDPVAYVSDCLARLSG